MPLKLHYSPDSPYARIVLILARETGQYEQIRLLPSEPWAIDRGGRGQRLTAYNPMGSIPTLTLEDGYTLFDSSVICDYLDHRHPGQKLYPESGARRWRALKQQSMAYGMIEAVNLRMMEEMRPEGQRSGDLILQIKGVIQRTMERWEVDVASLNGDPTIGQIAVACALHYLDQNFRWEDWRRSFPQLASWYYQITQRPSFAPESDERAMA